MCKKVASLHYILYHMQAIDSQRAQQMQSLEEELADKVKELAEKAEELKETYQKVR